MITGGAGLIGPHIADLVAFEQPREILVLDNFVRGRRDNLQRAAAAAPVRIIEGDIRDRALLAKIFEDVDIVFHQAAIRITQCAEEPRLAFDVLAGGTFDVLEAAVTAGVSKVVAASSASVRAAEIFQRQKRIIPTTTGRSMARRVQRGLLRSFAEMYGL